ncbi:TIGR03086 family metal-binding protein [Streptomyces sp. NPDC048297]|uniref:TIGR03086 family metal-binding protein n=1 Tax=Streptomyces sp. NPDC048297 TaxID=3365531 RepID=UPI0037190E5E
MSDSILDLGAQTRIMAQLAETVTDEQLSAPTPCPDYTVRNLLAHVLGLSVAFHAAARKDLGALTDTRPDATVPDLGPDWRERLPKVLDDLADAWRDPAAWTGTTRAGSVDLPGEVAGLVLADELVIHGWDLTRALDRPYAPDPAAIDAAHAFLRLAAEDPSRGGGIFGQIVPVPAEASLLDRAVGLSGRDPGWRP